MLSYARLSKCALVSLLFLLPGVALADFRVHSPIDSVANDPSANHSGKTQYGYVEHDELARVLGEAQPYRDEKELSSEALPFKCVGGCLVQHGELYYWRFQSRRRVSITDSEGATKIFWTSSPVEIHPFYCKNGKQTVPVDEDVVKVFNDGAGFRNVNARQIPESKLRAILASGTPADSGPFFDGSDREGSGCLLLKNGDCLFWMLYQKKYLLLQDEYADACILEAPTE